MVLSKEIEFSFSVQDTHDTETTLNHIGLVYRISLQSVFTFNILSDPCDYVVGSMLLFHFTDN